MQRVISIVIPTYNRPDSLARCLDAIAGQPGVGDAEVIVVDDGSDNENLANYERLASPSPFGDRFKFVRSPHQGRSAARNLGVKEARGERLLFLGDDVLLEPGSLAHHVQAGEGRGDIAIVGANPLRPPADFASTFSPSFWRHFDPLANANFEDGQEIGFRNFTTGNVSMDRAKFLELGGFDENFRLYGWEDIDLGFRFEKSGGRVIYDSNASAIHAHPTASHAELFSRETEHGASAHRFWSKWKVDSPESSEHVRFANFWGEKPEPGPAWRRNLGRAAITCLESVAPDSPSLDTLYERLIYSYRTLGAGQSSLERGREPGIT